MTEWVIQVDCLDSNEQKRSQSKETKAKQEQSGFS